MEPAADFFEVVKEQCDNDPAFRVSYLREAVQAYLDGELKVARIALRNLVKATIGFEALAERLDMKSPSLKRMLSADGNPTSSNLAAIITELQRNEGIVLRVVENPRKRSRTPEPA